MAATKISGLGVMPAIATGDLLPIVDVSNTGMGPGGTTLKTTVANLKTGLIGSGQTGATGITAAGTTQGTATAITAETNNVTTVAASTGVILAAYATTGLRQTVRNRGANALLVYPPSGTQIESLGNNVGYLLPAGAAMSFVWVSSALLIVVDVSFPLVAQINTAETQASGTSYANLATTGPVVTMTTGTSVRVNVSAGATRGASGSSAYMGIDVSGATTIAASDTQAAIAQSPGAGIASLARTILITGLTPGVNTFTAKYKNDGGGTTWTFYNRTIEVIPLN